MWTIRSAEASDARIWADLRALLWPESPAAEHRADVERFFAGRARYRPSEALLAQDAEGRIVGFAELSVRPWAEGCGSDRVAYLEGWYVCPEARRKGVGRSLLEAAERWGREQGCGEFASDADPENEVSRAAHLAHGFKDVGLVRCFAKRLADS